VVADAARHDRAEVAQVRGHVEREAVRRDPAARDAHADRGDLLAAHPHARQAGLAARSDAEGGQCTEQRLLQVAYVAVHVAAVRLEVQDGVADELTRPVVRDVAASSGLEQRDAHEPAFGIVREHVVRVRRRAERDDVRVLEQQQLVRDHAGAALADQRLLELERLAVLDGAEPARAQFPERGRPVCRPHRSTTAAEAAPAFGPRTHPLSSHPPGTSRGSRAAAT